MSIEFLLGLALVAIVVQGAIMWRMKWWIVRLHIRIFNLQMQDESAYSWRDQRMYRAFDQAQGVEVTRHSTDYNILRAPTGALHASIIEALVRVTTELVRREEARADDVRIWRTNDGG